MALKSSHSVDRVLISSSARNCADLIDLIKKAGVVLKFVPSSKLKQFKNCQGVVAFASNLEYFNLEEVLNFELSRNRKPFFLICDKIFDPHNLGALIRTAVATGVSGVILSKRECCPITAAVEKSSAGAVSLTKLIKVSNLANAIDFLKKSGVFVYCADLHGKCFFDQNLTGAIAVVVGSEGKGVSTLIKQKSDDVLTIPMVEQINSFNVSVAAGILMFEVAKQRNFK